ncbi:MAG: WD40 repeat domain-containing protein [Tannerella sp.]|jgi:hypothetical protein|nr:WD40 repeat domain-containing protein [Tannerella sp.]
MTQKLLILPAALLCLCCFSCKKEKIAIAGSGWQGIAIVDKVSGLTEWSHDLEEGDECNDIEVTPEGNVLYAYSKGAALVGRNHEKIWDYKAGENEEIHSATRLRDGSYMLGVCGQPARIVELDKNGKQLNEIPFNTVIFNLHNQFRQVTKTDDGVYLIPLIEKRKILRVTPDGNYKRSIFTGHDMFSVKVLENGNYLVSCGYDGMIEEIKHFEDSQDSVAITSSIKGGTLLYVGEIFLYENGNKLVANSNMYSDDKSQPLVIEIDRNNEVVWSLPFNREIKNVTSVYSFFE